ncbi:hypothetical protein DVH24_013476 [Malus domestica]|uniref:Uncharacterized protein n=1 Tax=Malus domestica TaxID=3750 RepID=A0A498HJ52_MALDO|nr:hypothetical protein DVH24_013476 [Malus domestica]
MPFGLILGSDSSSMDEPCEGTLRFSRHWILINVCVTQADILASAFSTTAHSLPRFGTALAACIETMSNQLLCLKAFRGELASFGFEWHFIPNHNLSADSLTSVGSDLHLVSPKLYPGHGSITQVLPLPMSRLLILQQACGQSLRLLPLLDSLRLEHKLVMFLAIGLSPSRVQYSIASPSSTTLVFHSHNLVFMV